MQGNYITPQVAVNKDKPKSCTCAHAGKEQRKDKKCPDQPLWVQ